VIPRRAALLATLALLAVPAAAPAAGGAEVCAHRAALYATPGGAAVAVVRRGDVVAVLRRGDTYWRVRARFGSRGWIRARAICAEDR
jgi:hypothetical protein